jgi:hypothetical protein
MAANRWISRLTLLCLFAACGCAGTRLLKFGKDDVPRAAADNPVIKIVALWQPTDGVGLDGKTCRGFAGQIMFLTNNSEVPAEVDGDIRIYVFDDQGTPEEQSKPIHQFDFPAEVWKTYLRDGKLGRSYALFIPYTRKGYFESECSLRLRYTAADGRITYSEMVNVSLPGSKRKDDAKGAEEPAGDLMPMARRAPVGTQKRTSLPSRTARETAPYTGIMPAQAVGNTHTADDRHEPVAMNAAERQRIVREALARMARENRERGTVDAGDETDEDDVPRGRSAPRANRITHALAESDDDQIPEADDLRPARRTTTPSSRSARRHSFELDDLDGEKNDSRPVRTISHEVRSSAPAQLPHHILEQADERAGDRDDRRANTFTIPVPHRARAR